MSDSVQPHKWKPTRLPRLWDSPGKNTGVGCHFLLQCMKVKSESEVAPSCPTLFDPMDSSLHQAPPSMGFSRQEYWSGLPLSVCLQCDRPGFDPWVGKIPWRRKWQPTSVLLPGKSHGWRSLGQATVHGVAKSRARLSDFTHSCVLVILYLFPLT